MSRRTVPENERREQIGVKLPPDLIERLDAYCARQPARPTRTAVIEAAIQEFLKKAEATPSRRKAG